MIIATITTTGWAVDKPKETIIKIPEDTLAYLNASREPITYGDMFKAFFDKRNYTKTNAGYEVEAITKESFEKWFYAKYMSKHLIDRLINIKFAQV